MKLGIYVHVYTFCADFGFIVVIKHLATNFAVETIFIIISHGVTCICKDTYTSMILMHGMYPVH